MKNKMNLFKMTVVCFFLSMNAAQAASSHSGLSILGFRASQISIIQTDGNLFSGAVAWTPAFWVNPTFGIRLSLGGFLSKSKVGDKGAVLDGEVLAVYSMNSFAFEVGGGQQDFISNGGMRTVLTGNVAYQTNLFIFDHVYFGYTAALIPTNLSHEFRLGVGTNF